MTIEKQDKKEMVSYMIWKSQKDAIKILAKSFNRSQGDIIRMLITQALGEIKDISGGAR